MGKKLLIVTQTLDENDPVLGFFCRWVEEFAKHFEKVTVMALNVGSHTLPGNVAVHSLGKELGMERTPRMLRYISLLVALRGEYDCVFAHMNPEYVIGGGLLWRFFRKKIGFWYVHGTVSLRLRAAILLSDAVFTASSQSCKVKSKKVRIVGHGIDVEAFTSGGEARMPSIISIGRFSPSKRLEVVIDAIKILKNEHISFDASLVGGAGTPDGKEYAEQVKKLARESGITVVPPVSHGDIPALLQKTTLFLSASNTGSLDKAILEAMACGVVPVTSNLAFKEMLSPFGLFVQEDPRAFARAARTLFTDESRRRNLSRSIREEIVRHHSLSNLVTLLENFYETV